jgi:ferredoxin
MKEYHYYSRRGRSARTYGLPVDPAHKFGIVFAVEMDKEMVFRAPQLAESIAVTRGYIEAAVVGMVLSYYIRELGYDARNHMDGDYLVIAPLVAWDAGLGEIGRSGLLVTREFGPRVRLGVVTTNMNLLVDAPAPFGVAELCGECDRCVRTCPGKAIPAGAGDILGGVEVWRINPEACYRHWRRLGSDCGICVASCPLAGDVPISLVEKMSKSPATRSVILRHHESRYGTRHYVRDKPDWL